MKRSELRSKTRRELYEMAKAYDLPGRSRMSKDDLVEGLSRVSAKKIQPKPKASKRRMAKRRRRKVVKVRSQRVSARKVPTSAAGPKAAPVTEAPVAYIDRGPELPANYNENRLQVMVRDPNWLYVYWDLSGGALEKVSKETTSGTWVLRVHDLDRDCYDDVRVLLEGGNWYVPVAADTQYRIDMGIIDSGGVFHLAASSRQVKTPRQGISDLVDEEWMIFEEAFRTLMNISDRMSHRLSGSRTISEIIGARQHMAGFSSAGISSFSGSRRR